MGIWNICPGNLIKWKNFHGTISITIQALFFKTPCRIQNAQMQTCCSIMSKHENELYKMHVCCLARGVCMCCQTDELRIMFSSFFLFITRSGLASEYIFGIYSLPICFSPPKNNQLYSYFFRNDRFVLRIHLYLFFCHQIYPPTSFATDLFSFFRYIISAWFYRKNVISVFNPSCIEVSQKLSCIPREISENTVRTPSARAKIHTYLHY